MGRRAPAATAALIGLSLGLVGCQREAATDGEAASSPPEAPTASGAAGAPASAAAGPQLRPGLWQVTMSIEGVGAAPATRMCVDEGMQSEMAVMGQSDPRCRQTRLERTAEGWAFASRCDMGTAGQMTSEGVVSGDFDSRYETRVTSRTTGAEVAHMNRETRMTSVAVWQGPCPADWRPGDVETPAGRINMVEAMEAAGANRPG